MLCFAAVFGVLDCELLVTSDGDFISIANGGLADGKKMEQGFVHV